MICFSDLASQDEDVVVAQAFNIIVNQRNHRYKLNSISNIITSGQNINQILLVKY